jgi:GAF domain-containing protein
MNPISFDAARAQLRTVLASGGSRAALAYLNSLTSQRFSSLFRFDGEHLRSVTFYDREAPEQESCDTIPVLASYCVFVRDSGTRFATTAALEDRRLDGHAKQAHVQSYCGVPLRDREGRMFGSVCHFDFSPGSIAERDVSLMEELADLLQPGLRDVAAA